MRVRSRHDERGVSLIAAIFLLVVVAFLGTSVVSLVSTQTMTSVGEAQSTQALYVAEGGAEFAQRALAQNLNWYRSTTDPIVIGSTALGSGTFTVNIYLPATLLRNRIPTAASTADIRVYTTARFPSSGYLQIEDDIGGSAEFVRYTGTTATTFTGIVRDVTIGGINGTAGAHERSSRVYPVTTLAEPGGLPSSCVAPASFRIATHPKFLGAGTIDIEGEEIRYGGSAISGGQMTLAGVQRCTNGVGPIAHANGAPVTPLLVESPLAAPDYEVETTSAGTVNTAGIGNAVRVVKKTVQR